MINFESEIAQPQISKVSVNRAKKGLMSGGSRIMSSSQGRSYGIEVAQMPESSASYSNSFIDASNNDLHANQLQS